MWTPGTCRELTPVGGTPWGEAIASIDPVFIAWIKPSALAKNWMPNPSIYGFFPYQ